MITVLAPSHRGHAELAAISRAFAAQQHPDRRLVIIENGPAIGTCARHGIHADAVLSSAHTKGDALNTGLAWLRAQGGGAWACWDDDDWYGPGYLEEVWAALQKHDLVGKRDIFIRRNDGRLWLVERTGRPLGHSFAGWSDCPEFRADKRFGEDSCLWRELRAAGARLGRLGPAHFVWQRGGDVTEHLWPADDEQTVQALTAGDRAAARVWDYGYSDYYEVINNAKIKRTARRVELPPLDMLNVPGIPPEFRARFRQLQTNAAHAAQE